MGLSREEDILEEALGERGWLCKGALLQPAQSHLLPLSWLHVHQVARCSRASAALGRRRREKLQICPFCTDFLLSCLQPQVQVLVTACGISPEPQEGTDGHICRSTGSCFQRGTCCSRYGALVWLFGGFLLAPAIC